VTARPDGVGGARKDARPTMEDKCDDDRGMQFRVYDQTNKVLLPSPSQTWAISPAMPTDVVVRCTPGTILCYGARADDDTSGHYWGVDIDASSVLKLGSNSIRIVSTQNGGSDYDDFEFMNVVLRFEK
jgi:hypothetical protein